MITDRETLESAICREERRGGKKAKLMAKPKTAYVCRECGASYGKWQGQCGECQAWNTIAEIKLSGPGPAAARQGYAGAAQARIIGLDQVSGLAEVRHSVQINEFDRVLGGGLVEGSVILIGGDPGIGKSTLLLQTMGALVGNTRAVYVSGEESLVQIASRATRLGIALQGLDALAETCIEKILEQVAQYQPKLIIIDSIQTIWTELLTAGR